MNSRRFFTWFFKITWIYEGRKSFHFFLIFFLIGLRTFSFIFLAYMLCQDYPISSKFLWFFDNLHLNLLFLFVDIFFFLCSYSTVFKGKVLWNIGNLSFYLGCINNLFKITFNTTSLIKLIFIIWKLSTKNIMLFFIILLYSFFQKVQKLLFFFFNYLGLSLITQIFGFCMNEIEGFFIRWFGFNLLFFLLNL